MFIGALAICGYIAIIALSVRAISRFVECMRTGNL